MIQKADKKSVITLEAKMVQGGPSDLRVEQWAANNKGLKKERCLGVLFQFKYPGNNAVHVIPPEPIRIPGRASQLSMWIHGRGDNYTLEVWLKDWRGNTHVLQMGALKFVGWKPVTVNIPPYIPQAVDTYPQTKTLVLERFVLRADTREEAKRVFFAFDQLKALSETFEVNFDGQELDSVFQNNQGQGGNNR
jgi:hypothetical protein